MSNLQFLKTFTVKKIALYSLLGFLLLPFSVSAEITGFQDFKGKSQVFENYLGKGKWLVVMMWASDCHICNREAHQYVDFHMIHSDTDATVLGISLDGENRKKEALGFIKKHSVDFPNLIAEPETVANLFQESTGQGFAGTPTFLIYSPKGELKAAQAGAVSTELIEDFIKKNSIDKVAEK